MQCKYSGKECEALKRVGGTKRRESEKKDRVVNDCPLTGEWAAGLGGWNHWMRCQARAVLGRLGEGDPCPERFEFSGRAGDDSTVGLQMLFLAL